MSEASEKIQAAMDAQGLTVESVFVPFSQSRNAGNKDLSLNWRVTLKRNGREVVTTDYTAGAGHCPAYKLSMKEAGGRNSIMRHEMLRHECETGRVYRRYGPGVAKIEPDAVSVVWSLTRDADVLDAGGFEEWASEYGYDADSRKAEKIYRDCLDLALKLRAGLGDEGLRALREAGEGY